MNDQKKNHNDICHRVLQQKKQLRRLVKNPEFHPTPDQIDEVILILGSSRSGSSLLYYLLSQHPGLISLQGEEVALTKLYGLNEINSFKDSDCLNVIHSPDYSDLAQEMLYDGGYQSQSAETTPRLVHDRAQRLLMQWPHIEFRLEDLLQVCSKEKWEDVIGSLARIYPEITLGRYDQFTDLEAGRTPDYFIEEPPFIIPKIKSYRNQTKAEKRILLLKSSINAFRGELLTKLFPKAEFKYIHLTRHPAASINGLMDGWLSNAFHSHHLGHLTTLNIEGYKHPHWWKFDLPPGWSEYTARPLVEVCSFQWKASNESILNFLKEKDPAVIKYENLLEFSELIASLKLICSKLQLNDSFLESLAPPPAVMSVVKPDQHRWKERAGLIQPMLASDGISSLARTLGYKVDT